jgi:replication factor A1
LLCSLEIIPSKLRQGEEVSCSCCQCSTANANWDRILIVLDLDVLEDLGECDKIGEPKPLETKPVEDEKSLPTAISSNGFYGTRPQNQPSVLSKRVPTPSSAHANIYPIEALSPYSHMWTIKARCTNKSAIKTWHNRNGEGKLFSVNLLDDSGEIRATGFNDQCDMLSGMFEEGSVYYISSPCRVQIAKKQFTNLNNDYELVFERDTKVEKVTTRICETLVSTVFGI